MNEPADFGRLAAAMLNPPRTSVRGASRNDVEAPDAYELDSITTVMRPPRGASTSARAGEAVVIPAFMVLREGADVPRGLAASLPFLALIVLAVVLVTIAGLAALGPWLVP